MKVSIIIPAYNVEKYIASSLNSAINQVYKNIEIIIVDDASTDRTKEIIKEYANKDKRIIPFYQAKNKGVSAARNVGLRAATGDFILFLDSDDYLTKDAIRRMIDLQDKYNSDYIDSYHLLYYKKKNGKIVSFTEKKLPKKTLVLGSLKDNIKVLDTYTYITGKLIKKELLDNLEFDESLSRYEDLVFEHEIKKKIKNYCLMNRPIYFYYQREDSLVNTLGKKHICYLDAAKKVKSIYSNYNREIKLQIEALLFQNMIFTLFTKIIKNNDTIDENVELSIDLLKQLIELFPEYENNKNINKILKNNVKKFINNKKKLKRFIKMINKIDFIKLYFNNMAIFNKYKLN